MELQQDIFFYHVMKTAGTSVVKLFEEAYGRESLCQFPTHEGADESGFVQNVSNNTPKVVTGHPDHFFALWGLAHKRSMPRFTMTFLRDPVDRYLSCYYFWTRSNYVNAHIEECNMSIEEALDCNTLRFTDNIMTKTFASLGADRDYLKPATHKDFTQAFANLRQMDFIGFVEDMRLSCALLASILGFTFSVLPAWNVNTKYPDKTECGKTVVRKVMLKNIYDLELVGHARDLFKLQVSEGDEAVASMVRSIKDADVVYKVKQR